MQCNLLIDSIDMKTPQKKGDMSSAAGAEDVELEEENEEDMEEEEEEDEVMGN